MVEQDHLISVEGLTKHFDLGSQGSIFRSRRIILRAVDGVNFHIDPHETLALIGESGCGKSTVGRLVVALEAPTAGVVYFEGKSVSHMRGRDLQELRRHVQIVFQDPGGSLDPRMTVGQLVSEPWDVFPKFVARSQRARRLDELLETVGLDPTDKGRYPHQFSGGQQQRIAIARALALEPRIIVADEPVSALDVSIQAQVLNLLRDLQSRLGVAFLFISHDLGVVANVAHRVAVMYLGKIVEYGERESVLSTPAHPYTAGLIAAAPRIEAEGQPSLRRTVRGEVPSPIDPPSGCSFRTRCWKAAPICAEEEPPLLPATQRSSVVACHFPEGVDAPVSGVSTSTSAGHHDRH